MALTTFEMIVIGIPSTAMLALIAWLIYLTRKHGKVQIFPPDKRDRKNK